MCNYSIYIINVVKVKKGEMFINLIPCPGPHIISDIITFEVPPLIAIQSSPNFMFN